MLEHPNDLHLIILISIMVISGAFGGYLNYLHNFDTRDQEKRDFGTRSKYILLGIGAAFLIPLFLKMLESELLSGDSDHLNYLIFAGFCLIAAIFSRRFISSIGDRVLEAAKNAEKAAQESKQKSESTQRELLTTKERIEDVKLAVDIHQSDSHPLKAMDAQAMDTLTALADTYIERTTVPDYAQRISLKAEMGRKMGEIIIRNRLSKEQITQEPLSEGIVLALAYAVQLRPETGDVAILNHIADHAGQLFTKYAILTAYNTLARNSLIAKNHLEGVHQKLKAFKKGADGSLLVKIAETENILGLIGLEG
jgi:hypothetical protein